MRRINHYGHWRNPKVPFAHIATFAAFVGAASFACAVEPISLVVEHVVALWAVGNAAAIPNDFGLTTPPFESLSEFAKES